jgi:methylenetetrahydrofolate reductase (NADPH)
VPSVFKAVDGLKVFRPDFVSVTYGAGGTTRALTEEIVVKVAREMDLVAMAHLTCVGQTREEVHQVLSRLESAGIQNVIALRGDPPRGQTTFVPVVGGFSHASELIEHIKSNFPFGIAAACYPEAHSESENWERDLEHIKRKVDLGAEVLITQLFYDNSFFYRMLERYRKKGIGAPVLAGVLPILSTSQIRRFTSLCGASIPEGLNAQLEKYAGDDDAARELGIEYATRQVEDLMSQGVEGIHFYVLNRTYSMTKILTNLGYPTMG